MNKLVIPDYIKLYLQKNISEREKRIQAERARDIELTTPEAEVRAKQKYERGTRPEAESRVRQKAGSIPTIKVHLKQGFRYPGNGEIINLTNRNQKEKQLQIIKKTYFNEETTSEVFNNWNNWFEIFNNTYIDNERLFPRENIGEMLTRANNNNYKLFDDNFEYLKLILEDLITKYNKNFNEEDLPKLDIHHNIHAINVNIPDNSEIHFIGDIHSSFHSLYYIFGKLRNKFVDSTMKLKENQYVIFTGDMVDYGRYGLEILFFIFNLKYLNYEQVYIINGNHEEYDMYTNDNQPNVNLNYEINNQAPGMKDTLIKILQRLPGVIFILFHKHLYQINHGAIIANDKSGYNSYNKTFDASISSLFTFIQNRKRYYYFFENIDSTNMSEGNDFLWGDFMYDITKPHEKGFTEHKSRNKYHHDIVKNYLNTHKISCIISGHQDTLSIGIMPNIENNPKSEIQIGPTENDKLYYEIDDKLITYKFGDKNVLKNDVYNFELKPYKDVLALTLSTAVTLTKFNTYHSFLTLS